jgi:DNA-binding NarL/FixJ family response regulator
MPAGAAGKSDAQLADLVERGRHAYARFAWADAYGSLSQAGELDAEDLVLLATSAYMLGRQVEWHDALEQAHHRYVETGDNLRAVRCAFWIGMTLAYVGEVARASGWLGRADRLLLREQQDNVERGYLLLPVMFQQEAAGDLDAAAATAARAAEMGERFGDSDLFALAVHAEGHMMIEGGRVADGLRRLDEAMVAVTAGEVSPVVTGLVYCGVILACQTAYELRRASEWTTVLSTWCERQPDLVAFTGTCRVHRAEILQLQGAWSEALDEALDAARRLPPGVNDLAAAQAYYRQGELHRLAGAFGPAEIAYRESSRHGWEPQPGLALLRLVQERPEAAAAAIQRALAETADRSKRAALLPACVEITLAVGRVDDARRAASELEEIAEDYGSDVLGAGAAQARGAVALADGDPAAALAALRRAAQAWQQLEAPYDAARTRALIAIACRALGDDEAVALELAAARDAFERLGAAPDIARVDAIMGGGTEEARGLTTRELEVLRLLAAGRSNRQIASALVISEHTVARHVQNIFRKLDVSSRAAAGAYAFQHDLA